MDFLIPVKQYKSLSGFYQLPNQLSVCSFWPEDRIPLNQLKADLKKRGIKLSAKQDGDIQIANGTHITNPEGYALTLRADGIRIASRAAAGTYYAVQTLRDYIRLYGKRLPCCEITDEPDVKRRILYHDCSRGKVPKLKTLKELIERLGHWKINELQLYIENVFTFKKHPLIGKGFSPFTPDDMLALKGHCRKHHIRFVPSLATLGHMEQVLRLPPYSKLGEMPGFRDFPGGTTLCPTDPRSIRLVKELMDEFVPLFDADDFNVCGDEPWELGKGRSVTAAKKHGKGQIYLDYMLKIHRLCKKHGKRMNLWADIVLNFPEILPKLPKDIVLLNWDYDARCEGRMKRAAEISRAGLSWVGCTGTGAWQSHTSRLETSMKNIRQFSGMIDRYGAEGFMNTDWGDFGHRNTLAVSLCSFAYAASAGWSLRPARDRDFIRRYVFHTYKNRVSGLEELFRASGGMGCGCDYGWDYKILAEGLDGKNLAQGIAHHFYGSRLPTDMNKIKSEIRVLKGLKLKSKPGKLDEFEEQSLREYELAVQMDILARKRWLLRCDITAGKTIPTKTLKKHRQEFQKMTDTFSTLWKKRNRPSRLADNIKSFRNVIKELDRMILE